MTTTPAAAARPPLDPARVRLPAHHTLELVAQAPSTNALAAARARAGAPEGLVVVTDHQTAGRGRLDRTWDTPARAALTCSVLLRPALPAGAWPWLPLMTGYAVWSALRDHGADARLKWPNDVLLGDRKVAGILLERVETAEGPAAVAGIGVNVTTTEEELPVPTATSLSLAGLDVAREDLLGSVLARLATAYAQVGEPEGLREAYAAACVTVGQDVSVQLPKGRTAGGVATGVDATGRLVVRDAGGETAIAAGDVVHVRPR